MRLMDSSKRGMATLWASTKVQLVSISQQFVYTRWHDEIWTSHHEFDGHDLKHWFDFKHFIWAFDWRSINRSNNHPQILLIYALFLQWKMYYWIFWSIKPLRHLNPWISCFLPLLDSFLCHMSVWNQYFVKEEFTNWTLNFCFSKHGMKSLDPSVILCFPSNLSSYNIRF